MKKNKNGSLFYETPCTTETALIIWHYDVVLFCSKLVRITPSLQHPPCTAVFDEPAAVCSECGCTLRVSGARCYDHITSVLEKLHWFPVWHRVDFKMATLVYLSLSGMAPAYLAADCQLVFNEGRCQSSVFCQLKVMCCQTDLQQLCRPKLCYCGSEVVEQSSGSSQTN